jgi:hypothetical protein
LAPESLETGCHVYPQGNPDGGEKVANRFRRQQRVQTTIGVETREDLALQRSQVVGQTVRLPSAVLQAREQIRFALWHRDAG